MPEQLDIHDLNGNFLHVQNRDEFYKDSLAEFEKEGKITKQVKAVVAIVLNSKGQLILQKRNKQKDFNANLLDKSVGGHVQAGQTYSEAVFQECSEELGFKAKIVSAQNFEASLNNYNLKETAVLKELGELSNYISKRKHANGYIQQPYMLKVYIGFYNGPLTFVDGECSGVELLTPTELEKDLHENPDRFTNEIQQIFSTYKKQIFALK